MDIQVILSQMAQLFAIMVVGFGLYRAGILNVDANQRLTKVVMNVTLPSLILHSVLQQEGGSSAEFFTFLKIAVLMYLALPVAGFLITLVIRAPRNERGLYMFMTVYSNVGFMGYPVIEAVYGPGAVFHAAIFNIIFNLSAFSMGILLINYGQEKKAAFEPRRLLSPGTIASVLAVLFYFLHVSLPSPVEGVLDMLGGLTTPLALLLMGSTLATMKLKMIFTEKRMYPFAILKQIGLPLLTWLIVSRFVSDPYVLGVTLILSAMPVANNSVLFATEFHCDEQLAAKVVFFTTLLSIVTLPLIVYVCGL